MRQFLLACIAVLCFSSSQAGRAQVMLGAYLPGDGWDVDEIVRFNKASAKPLSFVTLFTAFSHNWERQLTVQATNIYSHGAIPLVSLMPVDMSDPERNLLPEIASGRWDAYLNEWIAGLLQWVASYPASQRPMIMMRFAHEFNGDWYPYSGTPSEYVDAWQHVHRLFQRAGANNFVEWVWNANHISYDEHDDITRYYPGDSFVDWTSLDGYNWGTNHDWTEWDSFDQIFAAAYDTLITNYPDKPILIAEFGSAEPDDLPSRDWMQYGNNLDRQEDRGQWFIEMLDSIKRHYPAIRGLGLFSHNKELSWSMTGASSTGMAEYNRGIASDYFTPNFLCTRVMPQESNSRILEQYSRNVTADSPAINRVDARERPSILPLANRGATVVLRRQQIRPDVFAHAVSSRRPPGKEVKQAAVKSRNYRARVRSMSRGDRTRLAKKQLQVLDYQ